MSKTWEQMSDKEKANAEAENPTFRIEDNKVKKVIRISLPVEHLAEMPDIGYPLMIGFMEVITAQCKMALQKMTAEKKPGAGLIDPRQSGLPINLKVN